MQNELSAPRAWEDHPHTGHVNDNVERKQTLLILE